MGMTYTEEYETRKAVSEVTIGESSYKWEYIAKAPIDGKADEVSATIYRMGAEQPARLGYASYINGATSVRFDSSTGPFIEVQAALSAQFYSDLAVLIS